MGCSPPRRAGGDEMERPLVQETAQTTPAGWKKQFGLPLTCITLAAAPLLLSEHHVDLLVFAALLAIGGLGAGFLLGQAGIINLAQVAFYGIGAYATAYV